MDSKQAPEISDRDRVWANLRPLRPEIDRLAAGLFDASSDQRYLVRLLARAVAIELSLESREGSVEEAPAWDGWELPAWVRRDCEPHRGQMLDWLGMVSLFTSLASIFFVPGLIAVAVGVCVLVMVKQDREKMQRGLMDPRGEGKLRVAEAHAWQGIITAAVFVVFGLYMLFTSLR
jgi:hypothetical protein